MVSSVTSTQAQTGLRRPRAQDPTCEWGGAWLRRGHAKGYAPRGRQHAPHAVPRSPVGARGWDPT